MQTRRHFLRAAAGLAASGALLGLAGCSGAGEAATSAPGAGAEAPKARAGGRRALGPIGIQLYTVRSLLKDDFEGTIRALGAMGYKELEFAGLYERTPQKVRELLVEEGLTPVSAHVSYQRVRDELGPVIEEAKAVGYPYVIVPSIPQEMRASLDSYKTLADVLNRSAERARMAGVKLGYHNHAFEFEQIDGQRPYDVLLKATDPNLVKMEADLFWMLKGGVQPQAYFEAHPGRFAFVHVKDMTAGGEMAPVGEGGVDFAAIFALAEKGGIQHFIVEHDNPQDALASARTSYASLKKLRY